MSDSQSPNERGVSTPTASAVQIQIGELVLHGLDQVRSSGARYDLGAAVERELARLLAEHGIPPGLDQAGIVARLSGGSFEVAPGSSPDTLGLQIAQAVYQGFKR
ncbi:MAG: hypothetical protein JOZ51_20965 [Chloroflexi bacterium]|nr:hypothetical protein [Chloroflexota bacterium]